MASAKKNLKRRLLRARGIRPVDTMRRSLICGLLGASGALLGKLPVSASPKGAPIHFLFRPIDFSLDSCETPERHAPETMAGGVAVFDYDNDGNLDIFFANGADITTLRKSSPRYRNRLFHNNGKGAFTDVTEKAGLAGTGYDTGVAIGDYDNDGYEDIFVGGIYRTRSTTTTATEPLLTSRKRPGWRVPMKSTGRSG